MGETLRTTLRTTFYYFLIGLLFTAIVVYFYDRSFESLDIVIQGAILFALITLVLERVMRAVYTKIKLPAVLRVQVGIVLGVGLYTLGVWLTRPWLLVKIFNLPVFALTILPMFVIFALAFEWYFQKRSQAMNQGLDRYKKGRLKS